MFTIERIRYNRHTINYEGIILIALQTIKVVQNSVFSTVVAITIATIELKTVLMIKMIERLSLSVLIKKINITPANVEDIGKDNNQMLSKVKKEKV